MNKFKKILSVIAVLGAVFTLASCGSKVSATMSTIPTRTSIKVNVTLSDPNLELSNGSAYVTLEQEDTDGIISTKSLDVAKTISQQVIFTSLDVEVKYDITLYCTYGGKKHKMQKESVSTTKVGSEEDPSVITNIEELQAISDDEEGYYTLANDIDAAYSDFSTLFDGSTPFTGVFDGNGHKIINVTLGTSGSVLGITYTGLFGYNSGTIKNLTIENYKTYCSNYNQYVAVVAGYNTGTLENVKVVNPEIVSNCTGTGTIYAGGLVGYNFEGSTITDCSVTGLSLTVNAKNTSYVGGLIGLNNAPNSYERAQKISGCSAQGSINVTQANTNTSSSYKQLICAVGGLIGESGASLSNCYADTAIAVTISKVSAYATSYYARVGGLVGQLGLNSRSVIEGCASKTTISLISADLFEYEVGGLVGYVGILGTVKNSIFVGKNSSFTIDITNDSATGYLSDTVANVDATRCTLVTYTEKATETLTSGNPTKREDAVTSDFTVVTGAVSDFVTAN